MEEEVKTGCVPSGLRLNNFLNAVHRLEEEEKKHENIRYFFLQGQQQQQLVKKRISVNKGRKRYKFIREYLKNITTLENGML